MCEQHIFPLVWDEVELQRVAMLKGVFQIQETHDTKSQSLDSDLKTLRLYLK